MAPFFQKVTQALFAAGEVISPRLAGYLGFRLFVRTPNPNRVSGRELEILRGASGLMINARQHWLTTRFGRIRAYEFRPTVWRRSYPTILVVPGWRSRAEHHAGLARRLTQSGSRVIVIDLPGHGHSSGRRLDMPRAVAAVSEADQWFGPFAAAVGHSFGGAVLTSAIAGLVRGYSQVDIGRLVLIATPSAMRPVFADFGRAIGLGPKSQRYLEKTVEHLTGNPIEAFEISPALTRRQLPVSVFHCRDDREIPVESAFRIAKAGDHVRLHLTDSLGHRRIIADDTLHGEIAEIIGDRYCKAA